MVLPLVRRGRTAGSPGESQVEGPPGSRLSAFQYISSGHVGTCVFKKSTTGMGCGLGIAASGGWAAHCTSCIGNLGLPPACCSELQAETIQDAGHTEVGHHAFVHMRGADHPEKELFHSDRSMKVEPGTTTVLAIGPAPARRLRRCDWIDVSLKSR